MMTLVDTETLINELDVSLNPHGAASQIHERHMHTEERALPGDCVLASCGGSSRASELDFAAQAYIEHHLEAERWQSLVAGSDVRLHRLRLFGKPTGASWWALSDSDYRVVAAARLTPGSTSDSPPKVFLYVAPRLRRRGIGAAVIRVVYGAARGLGAREVEMITDSVIPGGQVLAAKCGGVPLRVVELLELSAREFKHGVETTVRRRAERLRTEGLTIGSWIKGRYETDEIQSIAALKHSLAIAYGTASAADPLERVTNILRREEDHLQHAGIERWRVRAIAIGGKLVGWNEFLWDPHDPQVLKHVCLTVDPSHRHRGIALRLFAVVPELIDLKTAVTTVRAARLPEPRARYTSLIVPWRVHHTQTRWRVPVERMREYIQSGR